jgi:hypothetical protein
VNNGYYLYYTIHQQDIHKLVAEYFDVNDSS